MNTVTLWSPARGRSARRPSLFAELDSWLRETAPATEGPAVDFRPAAEVARDGEDAVVRVEVPGLDIEKDVKVELHDGRLVIHGERRDEHTSNDSANGGRTVRELRYGSFRRSFTLPTHVTSDAVSASYDAGVLTVRVAGAYAGSTPKQIPITR